MSARVYVPTTLAGLAGYVADAAIPASEERVTAPDEGDESEYAALTEAAAESAALQEPPVRRVVVVAEASDPAGVIPMSEVVAVHVDTEDDADPDTDLAWYATQEVGELL